MCSTNTSWKQEEPSRLPEQLLEVHNSRGRLLRDHGHRHGSTNGYQTPGPPQPWHTHARPRWPGATVMAPTSSGPAGPCPPSSPARQGEPDAPLLSLMEQRPTPLSLGAHLVGLWQTHGFAQIALGWDNAPSGLFKPSILARSDTCTVRVGAAKAKGEDVSLHLKIQSGELSTSSS